MKKCDTIRDQIALYLDDELHHAELAAFDAHRQTCPECDRLCERERLVLDRIRTAKPLYTAPPELREQIERTLRVEPAPYVTPSSLRRRVSGILWPGRMFPRPRRAMAFAVVAAVLFAGYWAMTARRAVPASSEFARMAADAHLGRLRHQFPLEIKSESPAAISGWFAGRVAFRLKLPDNVAGQPPLSRLEGARLVTFRNEPVAFVSYRVQQQPVTLVVAGNALAMPSGGQEMVSKGLRLHYELIQGMKVITWADHGLTYALVSELDGYGQQSCVVCHEGAKDRELIESLRPVHSSL
jgi:anti-sigma factor RsiW